MSTVIVCTECVSESSHVDIVFKVQQDKLKSLCELQNNHKIWKNPLLIDAGQGKLTFLEWQFLFSQYYLYSKNFTRYLAALMVNCENDFYRSKLAKNIWEEGGETEVEQRHAEIFRIFLTQHLKICQPENLIFESYTHKFSDGYLKMCLDATTLEAASVLSLGTEAIIPRLYTIFRDGLKKMGLPEEAVYFFDLHIKCDDDHAETIQDIMLFYSNQEGWFEQCKNSMLKALDSRDLFFSQIYKSLQNIKLTTLINAASSKPAPDLLNDIPDNLVFDTSFSGNVLYKNIGNEVGLNFKVERLPFNASVLDPRLVNIPPGCNNELHNHAHETIFLILQGEGQVTIGGKVFPVKTGNIILVPRWFSHQTKNTGNTELKFFAITDYGLTKCFSGNTEASYRKSGQ